ncbi:MAG: XTP/dITP diphosphatase [Candidatus Schmidhempelia sp.]|nr:XTP/dITP diphosphatase [Candidatus Schmidhempelia sp.]
MQKIVLATNNQGKVKELNTLLSDAGFNVISQREFNVSDIDETGLTFVENAILKARHTAKITGLPAIADDSGLCVDALQGAPGIYSARYAGLITDDSRNNAKLLHALNHVPATQRTAYFYCALVYLKHANDPTPIICQGKWSGYILTEPRGEGGFGYDPLFYIPELDCSSAELTQEQKSALSHRGQALTMMLEALRHA